MDSFVLIQPLKEHENQYEEMMDEWESYGGRLNPGALRRYSYSQQRIVTYLEWLKWIESDKKDIQELYFFIKSNRILGAISIRFKSIGIDGHSGFGIRPSERNKGYATKMLSMALPIMKNYRINPVILSCNKNNIGSAKTILNNGGELVEEAVDLKSGNLINLYHIHL